MYNMYEREINKLTWSKSTLKYCESEDYQYLKSIETPKTPEELHFCADGVVKRRKNSSHISHTLRKEPKPRSKPLRPVHARTRLDENNLKPAFEYLKKFIKENSKEFTVPKRYEFGCKTKRCRYHAEFNSEYFGFYECINANTKRYYIEYDKLFDFADDTPFTYWEFRHGLINSKCLQEGTPYDGKANYTKRHSFTGKSIRYYVFDLVD